jgi:hypothetical protein
MTSQGAQLLTSVAAFRGELQKMLLALGVVLLIMIALWAVEEWRLRHIGAAMGWAGITCLAAFGIGAAALITVGLL